MKSSLDILLRRIRILTWFFIIGLVVSGATAIPLESELGYLVGLGAIGRFSWAAEWLVRVRDAIHQTNLAYPFMSYGTDWLAFAHFVIAVAFLGPLRDPVRNIWVYEFGLIACVLVIPQAFILGEIRGIPIYWRLIDCSFGVFGFIPLWLCRRWTLELERQKNLLIQRVRV